MAITLKFKTIAASLSGTALRQTLIDDANVIEAEANRVDTIVNGLAADVTAVWVSGTTYAINDFRRSPANFQIYRRLTAGAGTTDPSLDTTNWTESNNAEKTSTADLFADFVATGLLSPTSASLSTTLSAGVAYVIGSRVKKGADTFTYAASSDTYDDMSVSGLITHVAVANGAAVPALTSSTLRLQKVVTSATAVTSVVAMARNLPVVTQDKVAYTTAGTATAYTLTPIPALTALAANQRFRVKFNATAGAAPTLAISGLVAKPLMYYNELGVKVACGAANIILNLLSDIEYDGVDYVVTNPAGGNVFTSPVTAAAATTAGNVVRADQNVNDLTSVSATIATGFLTVGLQPCIIKFRNSAVANGAPNTKFVASTLTLATDNIGASLGLATAVRGRLFMLAIDDGTATPRLGIINSSCDMVLDEEGVLTSTTAIAGAVVSANTVYTAAALGAGLYPYKIVGAVDIVWTSGSGYVTTPALVTGAGGAIKLSTTTSFRAYQSTTQAIAAATLTKLLFQTENYDIGASFDASRFTAKAPCIMSFSAAVTAILAVGERAIVTAYVNGVDHTRIYDFSAGVAEFAAIGGSFIIRLATGDYVEMFVYYSVAEDTIIGTTATYFSGHRIG